MTLKSILNALGRLERLICILAFAVMTLSLLADVVARKAFQTGLVGATEVAVMAMIALSMAGIGVASDQAAHFRLSILDSLVPDTLEKLIERIAGLMTSAFFVILLILAVIMVGQSYSLGDRTEILRAPIWILQCFIILAFATNAMRYGLYAVSPELRPSADPVAGDDAALLEDA